MLGDLPRRFGGSDLSILEVLPRHFDTSEIPMLGDLPRRFGGPDLSILKVLPRHFAASEFPCWGIYLAASAVQIFRY